MESKEKKTREEDGNDLEDDKEEDELCIFSLGDKKKSNSEKDHQLNKLITLLKRKREREKKRNERKKKRNKRSW